MGLFDGIASAVTGAVAQLGGGILANNAQTAQAAEANRFSAEQNSAQMAFQERMRASQYQTAVEDMKKAGLSPMLAISQGGAGNLSGASAVGQQANIKNVADGMANSAATMANVKADLELKDTQSIKNIADTTAAEKQAQYTDTLAASEVLRMPGIPEQIKKITAERLNIDAQRELNTASTHATNMNTLISKTGDLPEAKVRGKHFTDIGYDPYKLRDITQGVNSASGAINAIKGSRVLPHVSESTSSSTHYRGK